MDEGAEQPDQDVEALDAQGGETYLLWHVMHGDVQHSCSSLSMAQGRSQITVLSHAIRCNLVQGILRLLTMLGVEHSFMDLRTGSDLQRSGGTGVGPGSESKMGHICMGTFKQGRTCKGPGPGSDPVPN